jgi:hypothetical protein
MSKSNINQMVKKMINSNNFSAITSATGGSLALLKNDPKFAAAAAALVGGGSIANSLLKHKLNKKGNK